MGVLASVFVFVCFVTPVWHVGRLRIKSRQELKQAQEMLDVAQEMLGVAREVLETQLGDVRSEIQFHRISIEQLQMPEGSIGHAEPALAIYQSHLRLLEAREADINEKLGELDSRDHPWILPPA